jgi:hypothetical protein
MRPAYQVAMLSALKSEDARATAKQSSSQPASANPDPGLDSVCVAIYAS